MKLFQQPVSKERLEKIVTAAKDLKTSQAIKELQKYYGRVQYPDELSETFSDLIGMETEREILQDALNFLRNIEEYQKNPLLSPHT